MIVVIERMFDAEAFSVRLVVKKSKTVVQCFFPRDGMQFNINISKNSSNMSADEEEVHCRLK